MDVLIKGMKIPKSCEECWMTYEGDSDNCPVVNESVVKYMAEEKKHPACPLVKVPPHGDWHTEPPTEEGWYVCKMKGIDLYETEYFTGANWNEEIIEKWQKIEETD